LLSSFIPDFDVHHKIHSSAFDIGTLVTLFTVAKHIKVIGIRHGLLGTAMLATPLLINVVASLDKAIGVGEYLVPAMEFHVQLVNLRLSFL